MYFLTSDAHCCIGQRFTAADKQSKFQNRPLKSRWSSTTGGKTMSFDYRYPRTSLRLTKLFGAMLSLPLLVLVLFEAPIISQAQSAMQAGVNDGHGKEWMQLPATGGLSWNATAQACPQDGVNACVGSIAGRNVNNWVWATDSQVLQLFSYFEPAMLTSRSVQGMTYFG